MKKIAIEIKWAILFIIMTLLWLAGEKWFGLHAEHVAQHATYTNFIAIPAVLLYVLALLDKRKNYFQGAMTYKQGFISGIIITVIVALLSPLSQYIISTWISPEYFENVKAYAITSGEMEAQEAADYFTLKNYMIQSVIGALGMGVVTSAIVAFLTRKKEAQASNPS